MSVITVGQAIERWLEVVVLEDTTPERHDDLIRLYVLPTFGTMPGSSRLLVSGSSSLSVEG
jgi:hypothetical protein